MISDVFSEAVGKIEQNLNYYEHIYAGEKSR